MKYVNSFILEKILSIHKKATLKKCLILIEQNVYINIFHLFNKVTINIILHIVCHRSELQALFLKKEKKSSGAFLFK